MNKHLEKRRDQLAEEQGNNHASPVIRSMYPLRSRGQMAKEFAQLYSLGFDACYAEMAPVIEALKEISKEFGTDYCDGNSLIAKEALEKIGVK